MHTVRTFDVRKRDVGPLFQLDQRNAQMLAGSNLRCWDLTRVGQQRRRSPNRWPVVDDVIEELRVLFGVERRNRMPRVVPVCPGCVNQRNHLSHLRFVQLDNGLEREAEDFVTRRKTNRWLSCSDCTRVMLVLPHLACKKALQTVKELYKSDYIVLLAKHGKAPV
jgi:hypothetical protein